MKDISQIDKNFSPDYIKLDKNDLKEYVVPNDKMDLYGVEYKKREKAFMRLPLSVAKKVSPGVSSLCYHTSGGRLRFRSNAKVMRIEAKSKGFPLMPHMALSGNAGFTLMQELENGKERHLYTFQRSYLKRKEKEFSFDFTLSGEMAEYTLYFPLYNDVRELRIYANKDAVVENGKKYEDVLPILYYGSSITQGGCASRSDTSYQAIISKWTNVDYINLGFSGCAKGEDAMIEHLASIPCSIFICDYDHNAPTVEHLKNTHYKLYSTFRKAHPLTPVIFASRPSYSKCVPDALERKKVILSTVRKAKRAGDKNVYFVDGFKMYPSEVHEACAVDGTHPTDLGFYFMAKAFYKPISKLLKEIIK